MKKRTASLALVSALGLGSVGLALNPALADTPVGDRAAKIKDALKGLVSDGTLTQAQADKVAETLDQQLPQRGPEGFGHKHDRGERVGVRLDEVATLLGLTREELRTKLEGGASLTELAKAKGIAKADLVAKLLAPLKTRLAERVKAGGLTQAEADARLAEAQTRVGEMVDRTGLPPRVHRFGPPGEHERSGTAAPSGFRPA